VRPRRIRFDSLEPIERDATFGGSRLALCQEKYGSPGRKYLLEDRGLDWSTISKFRIGYVPFSAPSDFGGRIVVPIFDAYDNLLALSVRPIYKVIRTRSDDEIVAIDLHGEADEYHFVDPFGNNQKIKMSEVQDVGEDKPKYWNEAYPKGEHLFGLNIAKQSIMKYRFAILVEGQIDVTVMHSYGLTNTVGVLGGAFTPLHAQLLKRWTRQIVVLMDGDVAGQAHAAKVTEILRLFESKPIQSISMSTLRHCVVSLPKDHDPDSFVRKNGSYVMRQNIMTQLVTSGMTFDKEWAAA
jgi:DNA primase